MAKQKVSITNTSIKSGVTSDAKKAICEYIWNGFDANAVHVEIEYAANEVGYISSFTIKDDGVDENRFTDKMINIGFVSSREEIRDIY